MLELGEDLIESIKVTMIMHYHNALKRLTRGV